MSKEDPVHYRNLLPLDSVLEEAAPMMHWRTCSVIEWSSPIHWWWNTWTQTFHSCPPALVLFQIQPTSAAQNISYSLHRNMNRYISFYYQKHFLMFPLIISTIGHEKPLSQLPLAFCHPASLKVCMGMLNAQSMQYSRTFFSIPV